jgi:hypothetical protein
VGGQGSRRLAAYVAVLLLAVLTTLPGAPLHAATSLSDGVVLSVASAGDVALAQSPTSAVHLIAKPVKRLPWAPAEPVRWSALLFVLLTTLAFGAVTVARRAWRWCPFVWRAPPVSVIA